MRGLVLTHNSPDRARRYLAVGSVLALGSSLLVATVATSAGAAAPERGSVSRTAVSDGGTFSSGRYIVQLADDPVGAYDGGVAGLAATRPAAGDKVDLASAAAGSYRSHLDDRQAQVLARIGGARTIYDYRSAFNGFAADLTAEQAAQLAKTAGVLAVNKDTLRQVDTARTPEFLRLTGRNGTWSRLGGPGAGGAGKGVVVGVIDTGIWPESRSFAPLPGDPAAPAGWSGICQTGERFAADECNSKILGARYFVEGFGAEQLAPEEYLSPRDGNGHGSHTASTAAGNFGVQATVEGIDFGRLSGMAPNAHVAAYKVCWTGTESEGCTGSDSVAAIDAAVEDGVDVLNYSISGSRASFLDPVEVAFLFAADAGVFVAASAGNSGPTESSVAHNSPWLTTVAAGTHDRDGQGAVTLGNGTTHQGKSITGGTEERTLVLAQDVAAAGADPAEAALCFPDSLSDRAAGQIVVCDRGVVGRTDKSLEVKRVGGAGMVLVNTSPNSVNADLHHVSTVHLDDVAGAAVKRYAATSGATAKIADARIVYGVKARAVADFSSRGPSLASGDLLKPDIMAPGVDVLAAVAPPSNNGRTFDFYSGTSMSSPHIAGIAALYLQAHPRWSPMMVKSAMMTTATRRDNKGAAIEGGAFDYGAGHVRPTQGLQPGLVYDSGSDDWLAFLCGTGQLQASYCADIAIDPSDLNYPSIAIGQLTGSQTVTRTVTNVSGAARTFTASVQAPAGVRVSVSPRSFTVARGAKQTYKVAFTRTDATLGAYQQGALTWKSAGFAVRSPLVVKPVAVAVPATLHGTGTVGDVSYPLDAGYTGDLRTNVDGMVPAVESTGKTLKPEQDATFQVQVPAGADLARFALFDRDYPAGTDLDLFVLKDGAVVGESAGGSSQEFVDLTEPAAGTYTVVVDAFGLAAGQSTVTPKVFSWAVDGDAAGNLRVKAPSGVVQGETYQLTAAWSSLRPGKRYLGSIKYTTDRQVVGSTKIQVDTDTD